MNAGQHEDIVACALHLLRVPEDRRAPLIQAAGGADYVDEVRCAFPFHDRFPGTWAALRHFLPGYRWDDDPSLGGLEILGEAGLHLVNAVVTGTSPDMIEACRRQPLVVLSDFRFPSAAELAVSASPGVRLHLVADMHVPHHVRGMLLGGHQAFEDDLEHKWAIHRLMLQQSKTWKFFNDRARACTFSSANVPDLIAECAEWTRWRFPAGDRSECSELEMIDVCLRAVGATMHACRLMEVA